MTCFRNRQRPAFPGSLPPSIIGAGELNFCVRDGNRCVLPAVVTGFVYSVHTLNPEQRTSSKPKCLKTFWSSFRPISIGQLNALLHLHLRPINVVVSHGSYQILGGNLFLWGASHLDAFSAYPVHTWLPSHALGRTTGTPEVCPSRSSRTKDSSTQISNAHSG